MKKFLSDHPYSLFTPLTQISPILLFGLFLLLPIIFVPFLTNAYLYPKLFLIIVITAILTVSVLARFIIQKTIILPNQLLLFILLALTCASYISVIVVPSDMYGSITAPTGLITMTLLCLLASILFLVRDYDHKESVLWGMSWGSFLMHIITIYILMGGTIPGVLQATLFTSTGSPFSSFLFSILSCIHLYPFVIKKIKKHEKKNLPFLIIMTGIISVGLVNSIYVMAKHTNLFMNPMDGISIMKKSLNISPWGIGAGNYIDAYTSFRPRTINQQQLWNFRFTTGPNALIHFYTTLGYVGGMLFLLFIIVESWYVIRGKYGTYTVLVGCTLIYTFLFPPDVLSFFVCIVCSILFISEPKKQWTLHTTSLPYGLFVLTILLFSGIIFKGSSYIIADWYHEKALQMANSNALTTALKLVDTAISYSPFSSQYRQTASTIAVTKAISQSEIPELNDQEKQAIIQDLDYAVSQSKQLLILSPNHSTSWQQSGFIYQQLTLITSDAQQWSFNQYIEAKKRDPMNPDIPFILGKLSLASKKYTDAVQYFDETIQLKPDYAPVYVPLGKTLEYLGKGKEAINAYQIADQLLSPNSPDRKELKLMNK